MGFRIGKGRRNTISMLRIISERILNMDGYCVRASETVIYT